MKMSSELNRRSKPAQRPSRRLARMVLTIAGLIGVVALPVLAWQCYAPPDSDPPTGEPAQRSVNAPGLSGLQDSLLDAYLQVQGEGAQAPMSDDPTPVTFTILPGETATQIAQLLEAEGLIRDANLFKALLRVHGVDTRLEAGDYQLRRNMSMIEIMETLQTGRPPTVFLTIPEGWRAGQIADWLASKELADADRFLELVQAGAGFEPESRPEGATSLEGYLFPDTYEFDSGATAADVIDRLLATFDARFTHEMRQQAEAHGLSIHEAVTLASIIEREAQIADERELISGVFHNRLEAGMHLNADPTVQYAFGYQASPGEWWKRPLYLEDLEVESPYNTYVHIGLPPGPICNPGLAALQAAVDPADTEYYYFVANDIAGDGSHVFARTLEEHSANIDKYRR
ncbi:MAG: Endolytic murein transglycosylase [Anaerolineales bacterium]|nr:Endolytic murein transglycosylase [Anaerolineales bacterium]